MKNAVFVLRILLTASALTCALSAIPAGLQPAEAKPKKATGQETFQQYCASCHVAGGNIIKPSKSLVESKKLNSFALFKNYLNSPTGHMPYYDNLCKNPKALKALYNYVKTLESLKLKQATGKSTLPTG